MPEEQVSPRSAWPASQIRGKTFLLAAASADEPTLAETARLLTRLGGEVVAEVTPGLDYLVVLGRQSGRLTAEERQVGSLGEVGRGVRVLDHPGLRDLLTPTREEALALLRGGDEGLEQWRLRRDDLSQAPVDLGGVDLSGAELTGIVLYRVRLDGADLREADLSRSCLGDLAGVNLDGARLAGAYVPHLADCTARRADLRNVRLNPGVIVRTDLTGANLANADGCATRSEQAVFRDADLTRASLQDSAFLQAVFDGANLAGAALDNCDLTGASLRGADLTRTSLRRVRLVDADLTGADLTGANLAGADLTGATVEAANFGGANLYAAALGALGPGRPRGLIPPPPVARERIGPAMRRLETAWRTTGGLDASLHVDPDGREVDFVQLVIRSWGRDAVRAFSSSPDRTYTCQAETPGEAMLEFAQLWPGAVLCPETLRARCGSARGTPKGLRELALAAWHEAFALPLPTPAERRARQAAHRRRLVDLLRGGPDGVQQWNALRSETLIRAGHFRRADLAGQDLRGVNLGKHPGASFEGLDFDGADFAGAVLTGGSLHDCSLVGACFRAAILDDVGCAGANLRQADLSEASLRGCNLRGSRCRGTDFRGADLRKADFGHADLRGADLSSANLERTRFEAVKHDAGTRFPEGFVFPVKSAERSGAPAGLAVGSRVRVETGAFAGMEGEVKGIHEPAGSYIVELAVFERAVPVELRYDDVEPV